LSPGGTKENSPGFPSLGTAPKKSPGPEGTAESSSHESGRTSTVFELGTGSGCLSIAIAKHCNDSKVVASDVSAEALDLAKNNAQTNGVIERIDFRLGNGFEVLRSGERFDVIVSNPPYIRSSEIESLQPEVRDFEPRGALDGGEDGLDWYRRIAKDGR